MMRIEVQEFMRASAKLFGLANEEGGLTLVEREAIVSFAQEVGKKFLPSRQQGDMPLALPLAHAACWTDPFRAHIHKAIFQQTGEYPNSSLFE